MKNGDLCLRIQNVIKKNQLKGFNSFYLVAINTDSDKCSEQYLIEDDWIIRLIEEEHKILFDDYLEKDISKNVQICLKEIETKKVVINNANWTLIEKTKQINPGRQNSDKFYSYSDLNPPLPKEDFYHRYVEVPISYKNPDWGKFKLYYELSSDFDEKKPTIMTPTDAQRDASQIGWADRYKKIFNPSFNIVTFEYRGMFCSKIAEFQHRDIDWSRAYESLHSDSAIEDMERIRLDLLGDRKMLLLGGSGTAILGLKYLSKYHKNVERAYLMGLFKDAEGSCNSAIIYFHKFLEKNNIRNLYDGVIKNAIVPLDGFIFLVQRLLYSDEKKAIELIKKTSQGNISLYEETLNKWGSVDYFVRSIQKYFPHIVVFMHETNLDTRINGIPDVNYPLFKTAGPLQKIEAKGLIPHQRFDIFNLEKVKTEVLLIAGTLDQVAPLNEMRKIYDLLANSKLAIFEAYHCLQTSPEEKKTRNELLEIFFRQGSESQEFRSYLKRNNESGGIFRELVEK